jgi:hypothetical protein
MVDEYDDFIGPIFSKEQDFVPGDGVPPLSEPSPAANGEGGEPLRLDMPLILVRLRRPQVFSGCLELRVASEGNGAERSPQETESAYDDAIDIAPSAANQENQTTACVPFQWTRDLKARVRALGYSEEAISTMTPAEGRKLVGGMSGADHDAVAAPALVPETPPQASTVPESPPADDKVDATEAAWREMRSAIESARRTVDLAEPDGADGSPGDFRVKVLRTQTIALASIAYRLDLPIANALLRWRTVLLRGKAEGQESAIVAENSFEWLKGEIEEATKKALEQAALEEIERERRERFEGLVFPNAERADGDQEGVSIADFYAYMPMHSYIYAPSREMWPAASVNARMPPVALVDPDGRPVVDDKGEQKTIPATAWLDKNKPVEQMTWAPGEPMVIPNRLISEGGWIERGKVSCFNLYRPPLIERGDADKAGPWLDHVRRVFADDCEHILNWLAQRVQRPQEKINHALVLGGGQGIGKDTLLEPIKRAVGPWNFVEVSPHHLLGRFNGFLRSVIMRVSEARDLGDIDRFQFYDHMKAYTAAPPDVLRVDEKHLREYSVPNCTGVVITTNHKTDGLYLPADDRRHYVAWSDFKKDEFDPNYWARIWGWYEEGGDRHVAAYLAKRDISAFDPKAPPPKTAAFWEIVDAHRSPEDAEFADAIDAMGKPAATTLLRIIAAAEFIPNVREFVAWIKDRKNRRLIPHRLESCGYVPVRNDGATDGLWKINGKRQAVYGRTDLPLRDRIGAARKLLPNTALGQCGQ